MYSNVVMGVEMHHFEQILTGYKKDKGYSYDTDMTAEDWQAIVGACVHALVDQTSVYMCKLPSL